MCKKQVVFVDDDSEEKHRLLLREVEEVPGPGYRLTFDDDLGGWQRAWLVAGPPTVAYAGDAEIYMVPIARIRPVDRERAPT